MNYAANMSDVLQQSNDTISTTSILHNNTNNGQHFQPMPQCEVTVSPSVRLKQL